MALLLVLLGIITNIATSEIPFLEVVRRWSVPLLGVVIILVLIGTAWQHLIEHPSSTRNWTAKRPPYPGLEAFTEEDTSVFFGREQQIDDLIQRLHPLLPRNTHRFVAVIGPSGSGKSSLVQAGLLPRLKQRQGRWVIVPPFLPGDHPITHLATSIAAMQSVGQVSSMIETLARRPLALIELAATLRARHGGRNTKVLLVVDQAEELITLSGTNERGEFLKVLRGAIRKDRNLWVIATLRSEFLTVFLQEGYADLFSDPVVLGSLDRKALFKVIEGPALQAGMRFEPGLVGRIVDDTGGGDALPLLAFTLQALYLRAGPGGSVLEEDYRQLGGVAGALSRQADRVSVELRRVEPESPIIMTLLKFVAIDENEPTRRRIVRSSLKEDERAVVDAFIEARLLTSDAADEIPICFVMIGLNQRLIGQPATATLLRRTATRPILLGIGPV